MSKKTKNILTWVIIFFIAFLFPAVMFCAFRRGCSREDLSIILPFGVGTAIFVILRSILEFKKEFGEKWLTPPKMEVPKDVQKEIKSFKIRFLSILGIIIFILGLIWGIIIQDMFLIWLFMFVGATIALPAGNVATKYIPIAKRSFRVFLILIIIFWIFLIVAIILNPTLFINWIRKILNI